MSRRAQFIFFCLGTGVFGYLVASIGTARLWSDALATGWMIVPIVFLYGVVHGCNTASLRLIIRDEPRRPSLAATYALVVAGSAINFTTPVVNVGGEPYKLSALAPALGTRRAAGAVILHAMVRAFSFALMWLTALFIGFALLPRTPWKMGLLATGVVIAGALILLLIGGHRHGILERVLDWGHRLPGLRRLARRFEARRPALVAADKQITDFYHRHPRRFLGAVLFEFGSRCLFVLELCLIGASIGVRVRYFDAFVIAGLESLITNLLFFVPFELGTRESSTYLLFHQLGYTSGLGLYAALVGRVRDLLWIAAGLVLIWTSGRRPSAEEPTAGGASA
jgi:uncharacterized protein (TIRG00374 family)